MELKHTILTDIHRNSGAQLAEFGGFLMPIQYEGIVKEHIWCRKYCAIFDTSHMGRLFISGESSESEINKIITIRTENIPAGKCRYCFMLNEKGGIIDDLIIYRITKNQWLIVTNASTKEKDKSHILKHINKSSLNDKTDTLGKIDIQGPLSKTVIEKICKLNIEDLHNYEFSGYDIIGDNYLISRTGYTGELGYEIYALNKTIVELWNLFLQDEIVKPAGLGARDTLRLEMGLPLYGQDLNEDITPIEANLEKFVDMSKEFIGKNSLLKKLKPEKIKVYFESLSRKSPRHNHKIYSQGKEIGVVTSGSFSPFLERGIGTGYINSEFNKNGLQIETGDEKKQVACKIISKKNLVNSVKESVKR